MDKQDEQRIREIAREEVIKYIQEEGNRFFRESIEFMEKARPSERDSDLSSRKS